MPRRYGVRPAALLPHGPLSPPLVRATSHAMSSADEVLGFVRGDRSGDFYPRLGHSNGLALESAVAELEDADGAVAFASGMAAISGALLALCSRGDRVLLARQVYGGTAAFADHDLQRLGVAVERFDALDLDDLERVLATGPARLVHVETPVNPTLRLVDLAGVAARCRAAGALLTVDGTFAPPPVQQALALGVDLVIHSATKFLGGHSDVLAGVVAGRHELLEPIADFRTRTGAALAPDVAWLLQRSLATLELRVAAQQRDAAAVAAGLADDVAAGRLLGVAYPGLADHPDHGLCREQMNGGGCLVGFEVPGGLAGAVQCFERLRVVARAPSLGGVESVASLPAHTTHVSLTPEQRRASGIPEGWIRVSVGLEGAARILADLRQACGIAPSA